MDTFIALFRGINVGGHNLISMADLAAILEQAGCEKVKTYIQSGNVAFCIENRETYTIAEEISTKILQKFGFSPKVFLFKVSEFEKAIQNNPFSEANGKVMHLFFLESPPAKPDLEGLTVIKENSEEFKLIDKVFYLYAPDGIGRSKLAASVEKKLGVPATGRNWNTVKKLLVLAKETTL